MVQMNQSSQFCPVCGGPFECFEVYNDSTGIIHPEGWEQLYGTRIEPSSDSRLCWASILSDSGIEWMESYRIISRTKHLKGHIYEHGGLQIPFNETALENNSTIDGFFVSDLVQDEESAGNMFILDTNRFDDIAVQYLVFRRFTTKSLDFVVPIHDICLGLVDKYIQARNEGISLNLPNFTLENFYDVLCKQGAKLNTGKLASSGLNRGGIGINGLEWEHDYYGARQFQESFAWNGLHGQEWYCANSIDIPNLTNFILSLLTPASKKMEFPSINSQYNSVCKEDSTSSEAYLQNLPAEMLHHICSFLPISSVFALRSSSKALASRLVPDQQFWFRRLIVGSLVPYIWDLDIKACHAKNHNGNWDWKTLAKLLTQKHDVMNAVGVMANAPIGFRNRCRIWKIIEVAMEE